MEHMDEEYEYRAFPTPALKAKPSEYMTCGRVFVSCEAEEKTLRYVPDFFPADNFCLRRTIPLDGQFRTAVATLADRNACRSSSSAKSSATTAAVLRAEGRSAEFGAAH